MPPQLVLAALLKEFIVVRTTPTCVERSRRCFRGGNGRALVNFGIGVPEFDGDVALQFRLEADRLHTGQGLYDGGFPVGDVTNGPDIDGGLPRNLCVYA